MKNTLIILSSLLLFPLVSSARVVGFKPSPPTNPALKPVETVVRPLETLLELPGSRIIDPAYKPPVLNLQTESCGPACVTAAQNFLSRETIRQVNRLKVDGGAEAESVGTVLNILPAVRAKLGNRGAKSDKVESVTSAVTGAIARSIQEGWDAATQSNVVQFVKDYYANPNSPALREQMRAVEENCPI